MNLLAMVEFLKYFFSLLPTNVVSATLNRKIRDCIVPNKDQVVDTIFKQLLKDYCVFVVLD